EVEVAAAQRDRGATGRAGEGAGDRGALHIDLDRFLGAADRGADLAGGGRDLDEVLDAGRAHRLGRDAAAQIEVALALEQRPLVGGVAAAAVVQPGARKPGLVLDEERERGRLAG